LITQTLAPGLTPNSRSYLNRWAQPDTIIPDPTIPGDWDRYSYVRSNPVAYIDPSGHCGLTADGKFDGQYDCDVKTIDSWSVEYRIRWFNQFLKAIGVTDGWFNNISGILHAFQDAGVGEPGSWISIVDAGILTSIQNGYAQFKFGYENLAGAANEWAAFFGEYYKIDQNKTLLQSLWGKAEAAGTSYGKGIANQMGLQPNLRESIFLGIGDIYRGVLAIPGGGGQVGSAFGNWVGDQLAPSCDPWDVVCTTGAQFIQNTSTSAGEAVGNWVTDPRSQVRFGYCPVCYVGYGPVYYVAIFILK